MVNIEKLFSRLRQRGYEIKKLTLYQYRVESVLDLYPVRFRWHNLSNNSRGGWMNLSGEDELANFIDQQVAIADKILDQAIAQGKVVEDRQPADRPKQKELFSSRQERKPSWIPWWAKIGAQE